MTDTPAAPAEPVWPYVTRHTCTLLDVTADAAVLDHDYRETCTECGRPWRVVWGRTAGARDTQPTWQCDGPPPDDWTPPTPDDDPPEATP